MTEYTGPASAPAEAPTGPADVFGTFTVPPVPETLEGVERAIAGLLHARTQPGHPLHHDAGLHDPRRADVLAYQDKLFEARERMKVPEVEPGMTMIDAERHMHNIGPFRAAVLDGEPLRPDDVQAANTALAHAVETLGLQRADASHLALAIQAATTDAARGRLPPPPERLTAEQERDVRDARALLTALERKGHGGFREALDRSGAGNDMRLISRLATIARQTGVAR